MGAFCFLLLRLVVVIGATTVADGQAAAAQSARKVLTVAQVVTMCHQHSSYKGHTTANVVGYYVHQPIMANGPILEGALFASSSLPANEGDQSAWPLPGTVHVVALLNMPHPSPIGQRGFIPSKRWLTMQGYLECFRGKPGLTAERYIQARPPSNP